MKMENSCYRLEAMALVSVAILVTAGGPAAAREAGNFQQAAVEFTASGDKVLVKNRQRKPRRDYLADRVKLDLAQANELQGKICQASIQDQVEWDYDGNRRWAKRNLETICENATYSLQPGVCFNRVMHGNINHGGGTRWHWRPALSLCAGTHDANATIQCFSDAIEARIPWQRAIEQCRAKP